MAQKNKWLLKRKNTLSASNMAPIIYMFAERLFEIGAFNANDILAMRHQPLYSSAYCIWLQMRMDDETYLEFQQHNQNQYTQRGQRFEETVKQRFSEAHPEFAVLPVEKQGHEIQEIKNAQGDSVGVISATLDYKIGENTVLECKTTNHFTWNKAYGSKPYFGWIIQLQMQMMLTGAKRGFLAVMVGSEEDGEWVETDFEVFEFAAEAKLQEAILYASYYFFTDFKDVPPQKNNIKKEEEIEEFLRKKQEAVRLEITEGNKLHEILARKRELKQEIEDVKKYLAEIEIEDKEANKAIAALANIQPELGGRILLYEDKAQIAKLEFRKDKDSVYTEKDIEDFKQIQVGALKRKGALKIFFTFTEMEDSNE
jgi:predicted phage-related endonuclease